MDPRTTTTHDGLMREGDAAALLNVSPRTLEAWRQRGAGPPYVAISRRCVRYPREALGHWLAERTRGSDNRAAG